MSTASIPVQPPATDASRHLAASQTAKGQETGTRFSQILETQQQSLSGQGQPPATEAPANTNGQGSGHKARHQTTDIDNTSLAQATSGHPYFQHDTVSALATTPENTHRQTHLESENTGWSPNSIANRSFGTKIGGAGSDIGQRSAIDGTLIGHSATGNSTGTEQSVSSKLFKPGKAAPLALHQSDRHSVNRTRGHPLAENRTEPASINPAQRQTTNKQVAPSLTHSVKTAAPDLLQPAADKSVVTIAEADNSTNNATGSLPLAMPLPSLIPPAADTPVPLAITTPLQQVSWSKDFSQQIQTWVRHSDDGTHTATLRLDPPELGPIRLTLSLNDNIAHAVFSSGHAAVRQAIENALPQLASQLAQNGVFLGQADVGDHAAGQQPEQFNQDNKQTASRPTVLSPAIAGNIQPTPVTTTIHRLAGNNLIDTFA